MAKQQKVENGEVLVLPADITDEAAKAAAKKEWIRRYVKKDGSLAKNRYAPIYARLGDEKGERLVFLYSAEGITLFKAQGEPIALTTRVVVS